jgi:peptidoglycan biosynthesis protein MviN/MurJ (putative lipid II flippase)
MKPSPVEYILMYVGSGFILATVFHGSLGLPNYFASLFLIAAMVCFLFHWRFRYRRAQIHPAGDTPYIGTLNRWVIPVVVLVIAGAVVAFFFEIFQR